MFKVIVAGSRDFEDYNLLEERLDFFFSEKKPDVILSGLASGADSLGKEYALSHDIQVEEHPAQWKKFGKSAGYRRNEEMAKNADALVAFWDGQSRGTKHMIDLADKYDLDIRVVSIHS